MKRYALLLIALVAVFSLSAVIRTVDNHVPSLGQYTTFSAAQTASAPGDTIYIYPSPNGYSGDYLSKQLTVIGGGTDPANPGLITSKFTPHVNAVGASGSVFIGLEVDSGPTYSYPVSVRNCVFNASMSCLRNGSTFTDCKFKGVVYVGDGSTQSLNNIFTGCTFLDPSYRVYLSSLASGAFFNCLFLGNSYHVYCSNVQTAAAFNNCVFVNSSTGTPYLASGSTATASLVFTNCIMETLYLSSIYSNFTYQYCIFEQSPPGITGPGNQFGVTMATVMVDVNGGNYHLAAGSPALNAGLGNVDIGLYGGSSPFDDLWYLTFLANITAFTCPPIVDAGGNLQLHIEAKCGN